MKAFYSQILVREKPERFERVPALAHVQLGDELFAALKAMDAFEKSCWGAAPADIKSDTLAYDIFTKGATPADSLESAKAAILGEVSLVSVQLKNRDESWTETVVLVRQHGRWRIVNIKWRNGRSLVRRLASFSRRRCA
ncbi:hypothetical protein [Pseudomonas sp. CGJS7]|uniref:hypothetical protein n=1 Tax=Pseudomonas sp. CGJS7 TaxID=3109348 RepID=UPI00300B03A5